MSSMTLRTTALQIVGRAVPRSGGTAFEIREERLELYMNMDHASVHTEQVRPPFLCAARVNLRGKNSLMHLYAVDPKIPGRRHC